MSLRLNVMMTRKAAGASRLRPVADVARLAEDPATIQPAVLILKGKSCVGEQQARLILAGVEEGAGFRV